VPLRRSAILVFAVSAACASQSGQSGDQAPAPTVLTAPVAAPGVLSRFSTEKLIVLPLQGLAASDPLGWRQLAGTELTFIPRIDTLLETELTGRRLGAKWSFASALSRAARRNPTYLTDPYAIRGIPAIVAHLRKPENPLSEPFSSQVRGLAGVSDTRYALIPLDVRFDSVAGRGRPVMRLALIDARAAKVTWWGEVRGATHDEYSTAVIDDLIQRVADLVIPR
jgi:hypothetical protein